MDIYDFLHYTNDCLSLSCILSLSVSLTENSTAVCVLMKSLTSL